MAITPQRQVNAVRELTRHLTVPLPRCWKGLTTQESSEGGYSIEEEMRCKGFKRRLDLYPEWRCAQHASTVQGGRGTEHRLKVRMNC
jgi:hypothetical protein